MESIYQKNKSTLYHLYPELFSEIENKKFELDYQTIITKENLPTVKLKNNNVDILFHSQYYPMKEASKILLSYIDNLPELIILGGFGLGYYLEIAIKLFPNIPIIISECNIDFLKIALQERDLTSLLTRNNVYLIISENHELLISLLKKLKKNVINIIIHNPSYLIYPEYYESLKEAVKKYINTKEINIATLNKFHKLWTKNLLNNTVEFITSPGVNIYFNQFTGFPGILIGAGPSLDNNIDNLKSAKGKAILIVVSTALKRLLEHGIEPDFVIVVDPQDICAKYFEGIDNYNPILIFEPSISNKILKMYSGRKLAISSVFPLAEWIESHSSFKGKLDMGGSVATTAYSFLYNSGCDPIILCGLDLSFSLGSLHNKGNYFEDKWFYNSNKINTLNNQNVFFFRRFQMTDAEGYNGDNVKLDRKFQMYLSWFESMFSKRHETIIDATEGGVKKKGTEQMPLQEAINNYCTKQIPDINNIYNQSLFDNSEIIKKLINNINSTILLFDNLLPMVIEGQKLSLELYNITKSNTNNKKYNTRLDEIIRKLDEIDNMILNNNDVNAILSLGFQNIIQSINDNLDYMLNEEEKHNPNLKASKNSCLLYDAIYDSLEYYKIYFNKALNRITNL